MREFHWSRTPLLSFENRTPNLPLMKAALFLSVCLGGAVFAESPSQSQEQLKLTLSSTPSLSLSGASGKSLDDASQGGFVVYSTSFKAPLLKGERAPVDYPGPGYRRLLETRE